MATLSLEAAGDHSQPVSHNPLPKYIPELDGLRAFAVLAVLAYHLNLKGFSLGWTGVLLFFVLSGFLITGILLDSKDRPGYFRNFYLRRALRIFPIYYLALGTVAVVAVWQRENLADLGYYLTYTQNYLLGFTNFTADFPTMFNHSWSLAVEEQFYLLWPAAVLLLDRRKLKVAIPAMLVIGVASRAAALFALHNPDVVPTVIYTSLPTQLDSLAVGAGLAVLVRSGARPETLARRALWVCVLVGAALFWLIDTTGVSNYWHVSGWATHLDNLPMPTLTALFWGALLAFVVLGNSLLSSVLRWGFLRQIGKISYGIYIYHFPVYVLVDSYLSPYLPHGDSLPVQSLVPLAKVAITCLMALASWHLVESPLLRLKKKFA